LGVTTLGIVTITLTKFFIFKFSLMTEQTKLSIMGLIVTPSIMTYSIMGKL
jgi:hypothetical protein